MNTAWASQIPRSLSAPTSTDCSSTHCPRRPSSSTRYSAAPRPAGREPLAPETGPAWLGNVVLDTVHRPGWPLSDGCDPVQVGCCACMEELLDVTVVGHHPSATAPDLVDVVLEGRLWAGEPRYTARTTAQPPDAAGYLLTGDDEQFGSCREITGVFHPRPEPPLRHATLLGCRPEPPLRRALDALARGAGYPAGALHRRRISASVSQVASDGSASYLLGVAIHGSVTGVRPSAMGDGLVDVTFDTAVADPMPTGARPIWELWRAGHPSEPGGWVGYDRELRHQWAGAALAHHRHGVPDRPPGTGYHLDGRHVTDIEGFYCAIGEAFNGPGGYFGGNADALHDCVRGGWGAASPIRLVWHDSAVARAHLVPGYDRRRWAPAITMDMLLRWLTDDGIEMELR
jgi:RNAse (barnase) inhibitor barstar